MRRFVWAFLVAIALVCGVAHAAAIFPTQVGGMTFRSSTTQFRTVCERAGGAVVSSSWAPYGDALLCTKVPDPPSGAPATYLRGDFCPSAGLCGATLYWSGDAPSHGDELYEALTVKYGSLSGVRRGGRDEDGAVQSRPASWLAQQCAKSPVSTWPLAIYWLFGDRVKGGGLRAVGRINLLFQCGPPGTVHTSAIYENGVAIDVDAVARTKGL